MTYLTAHLRSLWVTMSVGQPFELTQPTCICYQINDFWLASDILQWDSWIEKFWDGYVDSFLLSSLVNNRPYFLSRFSHFWPFGDQVVSDVQILASRNKFCRFKAYRTWPYILLTCKSICVTMKDILVHFIVTPTVTGLRAGTLSRRKFYILHSVQA